MKLLGNTKKVENSENVLKLESVEIILVNRNLVKNDYNMHQKYYLVLYQINNLGNY